MTNPCHHANLSALKRIEGQVRGIQKMIESGQYCVDILTQISAANSALMRVQDKVLERHLNGCVKNAMQGKSDRERQEKIDEIFVLLKRYRKG
ncbi:MAG: metal-sensitive transcriptional regulator [Candidatus Omnitrophica bacterium]|nr:metal-sensitive transcriptional regulator [Candidatus Omnitrophota bacterium]MCB9720147.1 metal-sensitive transcriptional regulator [Candidatus Omnitrophota bacterium]